MLGRHEDAIADYNKAILLQSEDAEIYSNRGAAKSELELEDEARVDFKTALEFARKANNANIVAQVEQQLLRDLDGAEGS